MAAVLCMFCHLATRGVEILLGKLAVGRITVQNKNSSLPVMEDERIVPVSVSYTKLKCGIIWAFMVTSAPVQRRELNLGSLSWELRTASPMGRYGERLQRDSCLKHTI